MRLLFSEQSAYGYLNSDPLALCHNFKKIDDPVGTSMMSDKCAEITKIGEHIKFR